MNYDDIPENDLIHFSIYRPDYDDNPEPYKFQIYYKKTNSGGDFSIDGTPIDGQQLAELGTLLLAIAAKYEHKTIDYASCCDLLDGFNIPIPTEAMKEIQNCT